MTNFSLKLNNCILFKNKSDNEINQIVSKLNCIVKTFEENETIFSPSDQLDKIGIIIGGTVDIQKIFPSGKIVILERKKIFDLIGEDSLFSRMPFCHDNFVANNKCKILFISKYSLLETFSYDKDFMMNFLEAVSNSALMLKHKVGILSLNSIQEKIAGFLVYHKKNRYMDSIITLPFSKKAWSEYMNVSRTSLSRELKKMEEQKIISFNKRTITVLDEEKLESILYN